MQALKCRLSPRRQIVELSVWDRVSACVSGVGHWKWLWLMADQSWAARVPFPLREQFRGWCVQSDTRALPNYQWAALKEVFPKAVWENRMKHEWENRNTSHKPTNKCPFIKTHQLEPWRKWSYLCAMVLRRKLKELVLQYMVQVQKSRNSNEHSDWKKDYICKLYEENGSLKN